MSERELDILLSQVKQGNQRAFEKLFDLYADRVFSFAQKLVKRKEIAEEIVQDVFLTLWKNHEQLDVSSNFTSYLFTITKNKSLNSIRKQVNINRLKAEAPKKSATTQNPEKQLIHKELKQEIQRAIEQLPPRQKQAFYLSRTEGKSYKEISEELEISVQTVKNQISSSLQFLRRRMLSIFF